MESDLVRYKKGEKKQKRSGGERQKKEIKKKKGVLIRLMRGKDSDKASLRKFNM